MSGLVGAVEGDVVARRVLLKAFERVWPSCFAEQIVDGFVAIHDVSSRNVGLSSVNGIVIAVDGENRLIRALDDTVTEARRRPQGAGAAVALASSQCLRAVGNWVQIAEGRVELAADPTATVPLYYAEHRDGFLFSSHLRPLAEAIGLGVDPVGIAEFLRFGYTVHDRTPFVGIRRVLGGQCVQWQRDGGVRIEERSRLWSGFSREFASPKIAADAMGEALDSAMNELGGASGKVSLMMSAGWDSRTLMAVAASNGMLERVACYSHGDLWSRELKIAEQLCDDLGVPWHAEPLDESNYDSDHLASAVRRTENVVFPHWHRAGRLLAPESGVVMAGVFGEMVGGRYWSAHAKGGAAKAATLFPMLLGLKGQPMLADAESLQQAKALFSLVDYSHSWTSNLADLRDEVSTQADINADVARALERYQRRGAAGLDQLAEAYQGEHIGSRYCNAQLLSVRGYTEVAFPLADSRLLEIATRTALPIRIQNSVSRQLVREREPRLLRRPMGATLAPASAPIVVQEASRVARKLYQMGNWSAHFVTGGRVPIPRLAWANYEFLRTGHVLRRTVESLQSSLWNKRALLAWVKRVEREQFHEQMLDPAELLGKMVTLDYLTR